MSLVDTTLTLWVDNIITEEQAMIILHQYAIALVNATKVSNIKPVFNLPSKACEYCDKVNRASHDVCKDCDEHKVSTMLLFTKGCVNCVYQHLNKGDNPCFGCLNNDTRIYYNLRSNSD